MSKSTEKRSPSLARARGILLAQTHDKAKSEALRLILADVDAEDAKISRLIEELRTQGLLS